MVKPLRFVGLFGLGWAVVIATTCGQATRPTSSPSSPGTDRPTTRPIVTTGPAGDAATARGTETIVFLRHGEKPAGGLGQITPQGLNRALALPAVLVRKYGKPDFIYAPDPSLTKVTEGHAAYFYVRPLITIEPTAIALGMPVLTPFGFSEIDKLDEELTKPKYAGQTVFVAWEHGYERRAAVNLMRQFGGDAEQVPKWAGNDYDSLYVVRITRSPGRKPTVAFTRDQEVLDGQSRAMPSPMTDATRP